MSFTWGLVVGTASPIPYFYSVFFITVLVHRTTRDFERCVPFPTVSMSPMLIRKLGVPSSMAKTGIAIARL
jgi:hypothetical protein